MGITLEYRGRLSLCQDSTVNMVRRKGDQTLIFLARFVCSLREQAFWFCLRCPHRGFDVPTFKSRDVTVLAM